MTVVKFIEHEFKSLRRVVLSCDLKRSPKCYVEWSTRHIEYNLRKTEHKCKSCHYRKIRSDSGKVSGRKAVETGQFKQFQKAALTPEVRRKAFETSVARGQRHFSSKFEELMFEKLSTWFEKNDISRWVFFRTKSGERANIDFYIKSLKLYIEIDGSYWHGLDRPYELLDERVRIKYDHDRRIDEDFSQRPTIKLIRFKDFEVEKLSFEEFQLRISSPILSLRINVDS